MTVDMRCCPEQAVLCHWDAKIWLAEVETQQVRTQRKQADETALFCSVPWPMLQQKKYIAVLSLWAKKKGELLCLPETQSWPQVKNHWHRGLIKLFSLTMAIRSRWETSTSLVIRDSTVKIQSHSYSRAKMPLASIGAARVWKSSDVKRVFAETDSAEDYADIIMLLSSPLLSFYMIWGRVPAEDTDALH